MFCMFASITLWSHVGADELLPACYLWVMGCSVGIKDNCKQFNIQDKYIYHI